MERAFGADFTQGGRPLPRARRHRRAAQAVVRGPHPRRGAQGARRARRVLGPVPDVHPAARRRLARLAEESRCSATSTTRASARCSLPRRRCGSRPTRRSRPRRHRCSAPTPTTCSTPCSASPPARSAACTTTAWSPAKYRSVRERRADPRRHRLRRPGPRRGLAASRPRAWPPASTPTRRALDHGTLPRLWHWACFLPIVPTAGSAVDGHPRRRPEMDDVPPAHVGRWARASANGRCGSASTRARLSRIVRAEREGRWQRALLARHRRARDQPGRRGVRRRGAGPRVPRGVRRARPPVPTATTRPTRPWVEELVADPVAAVPVLGGHRQRAPHPLRPPVRDRGRGLPRPRRARTAHRDPPRRAGAALGATATSTRCRTGPVRRTSPTARSG